MNLLIPSSEITPANRSYATAMYRYVFQTKDMRAVRQTALKNFNVLRVLYPTMPQWPMRFMSGAIPPPASGIA
jgi:hypothetical protein